MTECEVKIIVDDEGNASVIIEPVPLNNNNRDSNNSSGSWCGDHKAGTAEMAALKGRYDITGHYPV